MKHFYFGFKYALHRNAERNALRKKFCLNFSLSFLLFIISLLSVSDTSAQTATIDLTSEKQIIRGFGGMNHPSWIGDLTESQRNTAYGNAEEQLGFSILRIWVDSNSDNWYKEIASAKRVQELGGIVFATPWNPPTDMTETVTRNNRSEKRLMYSKYDAYAQHLNDFNNYMKTNGVNLYAISLANEPDYGYDWTWYSVDEIYNFTKNQAASLRINGTKVISAESFAYNKSYYDKVLDDASALSNIDIIGTHFYASDATTDVSFFQYAKADEKASGKERWMTEHYTSSESSTTDQVRADLWPEALDVSYEIYRAMAEGNFSAYVWWYIRRHYGPIKEDGLISKRGYCMAQYSKFIRPGYVRVEADKNPTYNVYVSAYKSGDDVVIVAVNRSTVTKTLTFSIPGTKVKTWEEYVTSETKNLSKEADITNSDGSFLITLDAQSTTTFVGKAPSGFPSVSLSIAEGQTSFESPASMEFNATASDTDGEIAKVEFYEGTQLLGEDNSSPYSFVWNNVREGSYAVIAVATDNDGNIAISDTVFVTVNVPQSPYGGVAQTIPGTVEAENYDLGGDGFAYYDNEVENKGDCYRTDGVDITGSDSEGYKIGWTIAGEWLEYTVDVEESAVYDYSAIVSSGNESSAFHLLLDDQNITDTIFIPQGADWDTYTTVKGKTSILSEGEHILRLVIDGSYCNIDKIIFEKENDEVGLDEIESSESACEDFIVYSVSGELRGFINMTEGISIYDELKRLHLLSGAYLLKAKDGNCSYLINYKN